MTENRKKKNTEGFTLMEMLIVVAIIAILIAIAIPVFSNMLERVREKTDLANVRGMYAEVMTAALTDDPNAVYRGPDGSAQTIKKEGEFSAVLRPLGQKTDDWQSKLPLIVGGISSEKVNGQASEDTRWIGRPKAGGSCTVKYIEETGDVFIIWSEGPEIPAEPDEEIPEDTENGGGYGQIRLDGVIDFDPVKGTAYSVEKGKMYRYKDQIYVCRQDFSTGSEWTDISSIIPNGNSWPYVLLKEDPVIITDDDVSHENDGSAFGHFQNISLGTVYISEDGKQYILSDGDYTSSWCQLPQSGNTNWTEF